MMKMLLLSVITILVINESSFMAQARPRDVVEAELATAVADIPRAFELWKTKFKKNFLKKEEAVRLANFKKTVNFCRKYNSNKKNLAWVNTLR